jgi:hypothetical protein
LRCSPVSAVSNTKELLPSSPTNKEHETSKKFMVLDKNDPATARILLDRILSSPLDEAWKSFEVYASLPMGVKRHRNPTQSLYHLARMLSKQYPRTRENYGRLIDLFQMLDRLDITIQVWQWNTLLDYSGKLNSQTSEDDYRAALRVVENMKEYYSGRETQTVNGREGNTRVEETLNEHTYTTLLAIGIRTYNPEVVKHAVQLLHSSPLPPCRTAELALLPYFAKTGELHAAMAVIESMHQRGLEVGIDGINSLLWVFASNGRLDLPIGIYRTLRERILPDVPVRQLKAYEPVTNVGEYKIPDDMEPNLITFTIMIQCLAFTGHYTMSLEIFRDLIATDRGKNVRAKDFPKITEEQPNAYLLPIYRALFLGFARHGFPASTLGTIGPGSVLTTRDEASPRKTNDYGDQEGLELSLRRRTPGQATGSWNYENLQVVFSMFLRDSGQYQPNGQLVYWILNAFARTSRNSITVMDNVWQQLNNHFKGAMTSQGLQNRLQYLARRWGKDKKEKPH